MSLLKLDSSSFQSTVSQGLTLVDFWAEWCGPCKAIAPTVDALAQDFGGRVVVGKLNVDENQQLAAQFNIRGIPTMILFKDGQPVDQIVGLTDENNIKSLIGRHQ